MPVGKHSTDITVMFGAYRSIAVSSFNLMKTSLEPTSENSPTWEI